MPFPWLTNFPDTFFDKFVIGVGTSFQRVRIYHVLPVGRIFLAIKKEENDKSRTRWKLVPTPKIFYLNICQGKKDRMRASPI